jgi:hypothetical protein
MRNLAIICAMCLLITPAILAQTVEVSAPPITDTDIQLLRSDLQAAKNQVIADTMKFTEAESTAFWPVYRDYTHDQNVIADKRLQVIKDYAKSYDTMDNAKAKDMVQRMMNVDDELLNLREKYWPKFEQALGAKRAAKFYQVDNRLSLMINLQLAAQIPLIP